MVFPVSPIAYLQIRSLVLTRLAKTGQAASTALEG
jgi:hypothetical protein